MCSIAGAVSLDLRQIPRLQRAMEVMNELQAHRGPDGEGIWTHPSGVAGLAHRRLSIIDIAGGAQPMADEGGNWICFNGEIYNFIELRAELGVSCRTTSDTEVILHAYRKWGEDCVSHLTGMFAFALWDEEKQRLFCARDRFGIKPFYYTVQEGVFYFASEMKALLPFLPAVKTDQKGFQEYLMFQFCLNGNTMFEGIRELKPAHRLTVEREVCRERRYWQVYYHLDLNHTEKYFEERLRECFRRSVRYHVRSDVPVGGYVSGGVDSSIIASLACQVLPEGEFMGFTGKFSRMGRAYDESAYAKELAKAKGFRLEELEITSDDFLNQIERVVYHLDCPVAGPGSFSQYMISSLAARHRKVVLGGQGGDEIFGGYTRYLVAYFEQCIKGAIEGTADTGDYIVTYESIIPNLVSLRSYKPMLREFWSSGLFDDPDKRYLSLINRAPKIADCIRWENLSDYDPYITYREIFAARNVEEKSYFDRMTHLDFKTLLPALLQVEDRMSMAHGLESRVPFLDHELVEFAATIPANVKFKNGNMKHVLRHAMREELPASIMERKDKMGFTTPFTEWAKNEAHDYIADILSSERAKGREFIDNRKVLEKINNESKFGRNIWGMLCLELWQRQFHDKARHYREMLDASAAG